MRALIVMFGIFGLCLFAYAPAAVALTGEKLDTGPGANWRMLDKQAEELYRFVVAGEWEKAQHKVTEIGKLMTETSFTGVTGVEGVRALSDAIVQVKRALPAVEINEPKLMHVTARLRLATDALTHPKQAMWLQYEQVLRDDMSRLMQAERKEDWQIRANQWLEHIDRIRAAAIIQRNPQSIEIMESIVQLVQRGVQGEIRTAEVNQTLNKYGDVLLSQLFGKSKEEPALGPLQNDSLPMQWTFMLAFIVCLTLTYVAFQKYRYEQDVIRPGRFRK
ncbi:sporulation protein YpjB [Paenibacillus sp. MER TA 81-3]|uniref:sporulation protein YpjB n=1 Tax=Paenibacillus sp. MER TA 81-3 TaxID=2939573 RepID=UPI002040CCB2|nr:sporulation protein YpjB [Paenibacillus sp. MER TA 81-3]MCM3341311.1 sporulation protein YpjB [Paenibacillus sp. MER TA 81-3]